MSDWRRILIDMYFNRHSSYWILWRAEFKFVLAIREESRTLIMKHDFRFINARGCVRNAGAINFLRVTRSMGGNLIMVYYIDQRHL